MNFFILSSITKKPVVCSVRDYVCPDTLMGVFNFSRDEIIVNSKLTLENIKYSIGRYMPEIKERIHLIPNGINRQLFKKSKPKKILELVGKLNTNNIILYPHRPDERKGIFIALELISRLKYRLGIKDIKLLLPLHLDMKVEDGKKSYYGKEHYKKVNDIAQKLRIKENILIHPWVPIKLMPEYYSLGKMTLSIGSFIEAFGSNSSVESLSCGTPAIISRVGAQRTTLPEDPVPKVDHGDIDSIEKLALQILKKGYNTKKAQEFIRETYNFERMLQSYEKIITSAQKRSALKPSFPKFEMQNAHFKTPPRCSLGRKGLYNGYEYTYQKVNKKIIDLLDKKGIFSLTEAQSEEISEKELAEEILKGNIVYDKND